MKPFHFILTILLSYLQFVIMAQSGSLDTQFGENGRALYHDLGYRPEASVVLIQDNENIVTVGHRQNGFGSQLQMLGYQTDGDVNVHFGGDNLFGLPTWGYPGIINTDFPDLDWEHVTSAHMQSDGKIVVGGYSGTNSDWLVARYKADGSVDSSFNAIGYDAEDHGGFERVAAVELDNSDQLIAFGEVNQKMRIIKYMDDGSPDGSFGNNGIVDLSPVSVGANDMKRSDSGALYILGSKSSGNTTTLITSKVNANGSIDHSFGTNGMTEIPIAGSYSSNIKLDLMPNGQPIIVADVVPSTGGYSRLQITKLTVDGHLDADFGNNGSLRYTMGDDYVTAHATMVQPNGKLLVAGRLVQNGAADMFVSKINSDGTFDTEFGDGGTAISGFATDLSNNAAKANAINLQADGKILLGGFIKENNIQKSAVVRFHNTVDTSYSSSGSPISSSRQLNIFPNPFSSHLSVQFPQGKWTTFNIYNLNGKLLRSYKVEEPINSMSITTLNGINENIICQLKGEFDQLSKVMVKSD